MRIPLNRFGSFNLAFAAVSILLLGASLAFGQDQPPQEQPNPAMSGQPGPGMMHGMGGPGMMQGMGGPGMMQGMAGRGMMQRQQMMPEMNRPAMMRGMTRMRRMEPMAGLLRRPDVQKELGLTPEQLQKLDEIRFNGEKETIRHRSALQIMHLELAHLTGAENPDRAAIDKKIQETAQEESALMRTSVNARLDARGVLTAEQRTKLKQFMQNQPRPERSFGGGAMRPGAARKRAPAPAAPAKPPAQ